MAYLGNAPGQSTQRVTTTFTATEGQTSFTPVSGYTPGYVDVYLNGVKLIDTSDYVATNGVSIDLITGADLDSVLEVVAYIPRGLSDGYTKAEADGKYLLNTTDTFTGDLNVTGRVTSDDYYASNPNYVLSPSGTSYLKNIYVTESDTVDGYLQLGENYVYGYDSATDGSINITTAGDSFIDAGNFGIGTDSPEALLHVNGAGTWIRHTGTDGYVDVGNWYSGEGRVESDLPLKIRTGNVDSPISIAPAGVTGLYVDGSKNVGIGNTNPALYSSYTNLRIGSSEANSAGLIKFSSSYNSEDGAEIYQASVGDVHINRDSSTNLMSLSADRNLSIANSKLPTGAGTFNYFTAKGSSFAGFTTETGIFNNAYYNSTAGEYRTVNAGASSRLYFGSTGKFLFESAPSVAADTANNFGVKMLLETDKGRTNYSNLLINKSSSIYDTNNRGSIEIDGINNSLLALTVSGAEGGYLYQDGNITQLANIPADGQIKFYAGGSHHATLDHTGTYTLAKYASSGHNAGEFNIGKSTVGAIHLNGGTGSGATDARSIAITHEANGDTQAAIVFENNNTDGTRVAVFTTQSYGVGPQRGLEVTNRGEVLTPRNPSFLAYHTSGTKPAGVQVFTDVWSNVAAGYNTSNGRFTAAIAGAYQINAALLSANNSFIACYLQVNGSTILFTENTRAENNFAAGHINATVYLNAGDYVTVTSSTRDTYGSKWCYFSGHLVG